MSTICEQTLTVRPRRQPKPGLVNESRGLQGLARTFVMEPIGSKLAQFIVDQREQFLGRVRIAFLCSLQYESDIAHQLDRIETRSSRKAHSTRPGARPKE